MLIADQPPTAASPARGPRQVIRFAGLADVIAVARQLWEAQCLPRGVDRWEKLVPMLLAGAELGLGIMQTLKSITPPVNGQCNLFGDAGLALVRASGLLLKLDERIDGEGDARKAVCVVQRQGGPVKTFEYPMALAVKLKSYQAAVKQKTGPWHDDPDNMLMWRARWRALRTEFTDILMGMGGAEEAEDEQPITVDVVPPSGTLPPQVVGTPPAVASPAALPAATPTAVPAETLKELVRLKGIFDDTYTTADKGQWAAYLAARGVAKARELSAEAAAEMCEHFGRLLDPFTYPPASTPPANGPTA